MAADMGFSAVVGGGAVLIRTLAHPN